MKEDLINIGNMSVIEDSKYQCCECAKLSTSAHWEIPCPSRKENCIGTTHRDNNKTIESNVDVMEYFYNNAAPNLQPLSLADLFSAMIWYLADNGNQILKTQKSWFLDNIKHKVEVALRMTSVSPFNNEDEMVDILNNVKDKWPDLDDMCERFKSIFKKNIKGITEND